MAYCTYTDLVERFGAPELSQLTNNTGDCPRVQSAIADASSQIDAYLANRYTLPLLPPIPVILKRCACDLARYALWDLQADEIVRARYDDAIALLKSMASGSMRLEVVAATEPTQTLVKFSQDDRDAWRNIRKQQAGYASSRFW